MEPMAGVALQNQLLLLAMLPFVAALLVATLPQRMSSFVAGLSMALALVLLAALGPSVIDGAVLRVELDWVPSAGLALPLRLDGFAWLFAALVSGIGLLVVIYARYYMAGKDGLARFFALLLGFTGAMQGILLSGNILMLVVFWELTSLFSFLLIGFWHKSAAARDGARTALLVTASGGLCLLLGMLIIGQIAGSYDLDAVLAAGRRSPAHPLYGLALTLVLIGAFTKSAQFPFHFWLPGAMSAPTPVSAFLHQRDHGQGGGVPADPLFARSRRNRAWFMAVAGTGMATMLIGGLIAMFRHDLKGLLAYSTISHLGLITALAGIGSQGAIVAAIFHIVNHAMFKAALFMTAGTVDHQTGTRDIRRLGGLRRAMPLTAALAIIASAAMAGVPLLNGFLSKEMFLAEAVAWHNGTVLDDALPYLAVVGSVFSVAYSFRLVMSVFFGAPRETLPKAPARAGLGDVHAGCGAGGGMSCSRAGPHAGRGGRSTMLGTRLSARTSHPPPSPSGTASTRP